MLLDDLNMLCPNCNPIQSKSRLGGLQYNMSCSDIMAKEHGGSHSIQNNNRLELGGGHKVQGVAYGRGISANYCVRNNKYIVTIGIIVTIAHVWSGDDRSRGAEFQDVTPNQYIYNK